jgi:ATP-dependent DNA helicase DinG
MVNYSGEAFTLRAMIKANISFDIEEILSGGGVIAQHFAEFESRPQQIRMACAVQQALSHKKHLAVEAGTGVGKSFAYLIPAIEAADRGGGKVLISTYTITLQEQLINKDIPFLAGCMANSFTAVLAKGRGNYLCMRRLELALRKQRQLFSQLADELFEIGKWATGTKDGSLSELPFVPNVGAWDAVNSEHGNCPGRRCRHFANCFYRKARRRLENADIIVANHALMFSDLVLKEESVSLLPEYKYVIIDEAHDIENVAEEHFGIDISDRKIRYLLDGLYNLRTHKGILAYRKDAEKAIDLVGRINKASNRFFKNVKSWYKENVEENGGRCYKNFMDDNLSGYLKQLQTELSRLSNRTADVDEKFELIRFINRLAVMTKELNSFLCQEKNDYVYWVEASEGKRKLVRLKSAALNVGPDVKRCLFDKYDSVILTSATLSSDGAIPIRNVSEGIFNGANEKEGFKFFAGRIGLADFEAVKLGSPFDYEKQVTVYIEKDLPDPNDKDFIEHAAKRIKKYLLQTEGRAFVLFTSYSMLEKAVDIMNEWLKENDIELLQQGGGMDRGVLLRCFRKAKRAVLFGTDSFWQGVDVPGEALSNVIIVRLPFAVPNQPLLAGRLEQIRNEGGSPFFDYQLPLAIIKFKQGFGRLIRSKNDRGIVVILDSRIINKRYGMKFLSAIPKCAVKIVSRKE